MTASTRQRSWAFFDFANSVVIINGSLYISQWVAGHGVSDFWYGLVFSLSTIVLLFTAPAVGWLVDQTRHKVWWLKLHAIAIACMAVLITWIATLSGGGVITRVAIVLLLFFLLSYLYQTSLVFYNSMIMEVVPVETRAVWSGIGEGLGHFGSIAGILLLLPIVQWGLPPFLPAAGISAVAPAGLISLVMVWLVLHGISINASSLGVASETISGRYRQAWADFVEANRNPVTRKFLIAYYFYADAILSVQLFIPLYIKRVYSLEPSAVALTVFIALITSGIGAIASGYIARLFGLRRLLLMVLSAWIVGLVGIAVAPNFPIFLAIFGSCGFLFGAVWGLSRAYMALIIPSDHSGHYFGLYAVAERFSAIIGPLVWGGVVMALAPAEDTGERVAIATMAILLAVGLWIAKGLPEIYPNKSVLLSTDSADVYNKGKSG
jgi:UMF1 family MFS transporter